MVTSVTGHVEAMWPRSCCCGRAGGSAVRAVPRPGHVTQPPNGAGHRCAGSVGPGWEDTPDGRERSKDTIMAARPEVVALLTDFDVQRTGSGQRLVHRNGTPFTAQEADLLASATDDDMRAAASELAAVPERLAELFMPYIRTVAEQIGDHPPTTEEP